MYLPFSSCFLSGDKTLTHSPASLPRLGCLPEPRILKGAEPACPRQSDGHSQSRGDPGKEWPSWLVLLSLQPGSLSAISSVLLSPLNPVPLPLSLGRITCLLHNLTVPTLFQISPHNQSSVTSTASSHLHSTTPPHPHSFLMASGTNHTHLFYCSSGHLK